MSNNLRTLESCGLKTSRGAYCLTKWTSVLSLFWWSSEEHVAEMFNSYLLDNPAVIFDNGSISALISFSDDFFLIVFRILAECVSRYLLHCATMTNSFWNPATYSYKGWQGFIFVCLTLGLWQLHTDRESGPHTSSSQKPRSRSSLSLGHTLLIARKNGDGWIKYGSSDFKHGVSHSAHIPLVKARHTGRVVSLS